MQVLEKGSVRQLSPEDVDAYIEKVMRELLYPFFLRKRVHQAIYEFFCDEFGLDAALSEMPTDQLGFRIGKPRDVAQDFAAQYRYAWLRGAMPAWKKWCIVVVAAVLILLAALLTVHVVWQLAYDHGGWTDDSSGTHPYTSFDDSHPNVQFY